jgi:A/G-specific adenine glycosylase
LQTEDLRRDLLAWFDEHQRDLPWRKTKDPYAIWVSEIMLQQTQVSTVLPYYARWMERFPTAGALAEADEQEVLSYWQGLGYYRRGRNLLKGAQFVRERGVPRTANEWLSVPGVGRYTSGAIASIAHGEPTPVVDGNVERVFARLTGNCASGPDLHKAAWLWAEKLVPKSRPGDWNQALMELGATVCTPRKPLCPACPVKTYCSAYREDKQEELPTPKVATKPIHLSYIVWIPYNAGSFGLRQIPEGQWWHGMWEFPRAVESADLQKLLPDVKPQRLTVLKHQVTHHKIVLEAFVADVAVRNAKLNWHTAVELEALPMPAPQRRLLRLAAARC